jgi:hypothetical protein
MPSVECRKLPLRGSWHFAIQFRGLLRAIMLLGATNSDFTTKFDFRAN